jgi:uncharacterized protein YegL
MKKGLTELVFIIDRSGSMGGLENDTIGGFNAMLKEQQAVEGDAVVTTVLFDDKYELLHDRIDIRAVAPLTDKDYTVRGTTALLDALGRTIHKIRAAQKHTAENYRAEKVLFVIITDGQENASREYSAERIKTRIERQKQKYGWEFVFFGANMDAVMEAGKLGISADRAQNYCADAVGTSVAYTAMSAFSTAYRGTGVDGASIKSEGKPSEHASSDEFKAAFANLKAAVGGAKGAADKLADVFGDIVAVTEKNNGKIPDVNNIARQVLEDEFKELEEHGGDAVRINELRDVLR